MLVKSEKSRQVKIKKPKTNRNWGPFVKKREIDEINIREEKYRKSQKGTYFGAGLIVIMGLQRYCLKRFVKLFFIFQ